MNAFLSKTLQFFFLPFFFYFHFYPPNNGDIWIYNSIFQNLSNDKGGAILLISSNIRFLLENSLFNFCFSTNGYGGAIHFSCLTSSLIFNKICSYKCFNNGCYGQFSYSISTNNNSNFYCSIIYSSNIPKPTEVALYFGNGLQITKNLNSSNHYTMYSSSIYFYNSINGIISFITISSNFATLHGIIIFTGGNNSCFFSNFINNSQLSTSYGIFLQQHLNSLTFIENCIIFNNSQYLFYSQYLNSLFIKNCFIQNLYYTSNAILSSIKDFTLTFSIIHFQTKFCDALIPYENLTKNIFFQKKFLFKFFLFFLNKLI